MLFGAIGTLISCTVISLGIFDNFMYAVYTDIQFLFFSLLFLWVGIGSQGAVLGVGLVC